MKRHEFLKGIGLAGLGALPFARAAAQMADGKTAACPTLIPTETEGPFPLDLTTGNAATYFRTDIRESKSGSQLNLKIRVLGAANCLPIANARVNIWHCDAVGAYSGYSTAQGNTSNTVGQTYLRGYQMTDAAGEVNFTTIFPGWYNGRIAHIHFQVLPNGGSARVSQMTWDIAAKNALYAANPTVYKNNGAPDGTASYTADNIFSDGTSEQIATLTGSGTGPYTSELTVTVPGSGTATSIAETEMQSLGFALGQNFPNPYSGSTTVPFTLAERSDVKLAIYDTNARRLIAMERQGLSAGDHIILVDMGELRLVTANYLYQLEVTNSKGTTRNVKMMTALK